MACEGESIMTPTDAILYTAFGASLAIAVFCLSIVMHGEVRARRERDRRFVRAVSGAVRSPLPKGNVVSIERARELKSRRIA